MASTLRELCSEIATAIRGKLGTTTKIEAWDFPTEINKIQTKPDNLYVVTGQSSNTSRGTVTGSGQCTKDMVVNVTAHPKSGYKVGSWTLDHGYTVSGTPTTVAHTVTSDITMTCNFTADSSTADLWTAGTLSSGGSFSRSNKWAVAYGGGTFVIGDSSHFYYSQDQGRTWRASSLSGSLYNNSPSSRNGRMSIIYTGSNFITSPTFGGTSYGNYKYATSAKGSAFTASEATGLNYSQSGSVTVYPIYNTIIKGNSNYVTAGDEAIATSTTGGRWSIKIKGADFSISNGFYANNKYVLMDNQDQNHYLMSSNGTSWEDEYYDVGAANCMCYNGSRFIALGTNVGMISTTGLSESWTEVTVPSGTWQNIAAIGNKVIALDSSGKFMYSLDGGSNWTLSNKTRYNQRYAIAASDSTFVIAYSSYIYYLDAADLT